MPHSSCSALHGVNSNYDKKVILQIRPYVVKSLYYRVNYIRLEVRTRV